jgi:hypothetical protein
LADGPRAQCSSRVRRVLARLCFRSGFALGFCCSRFANGPSFSSGRFGTRADGLPGLRGRFVFLGSVLVVLLSLTDSPCPRPDGPVALADCPRHLAGLSVRPLRTVRPARPDSPPEVDSLVTCFDSFLSYGPPWAHYLGGYQDRLLGGPLGLPGLRCTAPDGVKHKDYRGEVLG